MSESTTTATPARNASTITMLQSQAESLNQMFNSISKQVDAIPATEDISKLVRLALKIQSQCRTTLQMLVKLQNPAPARKPRAKKEPATQPAVKTRPPLSAEEEAISDEVYAELLERYGQEQIDEYIRKGEAETERRKAANPHLAHIYT